jgi:hypothetical protein
MSILNDPIYQAITSLLCIKKPISYSEVASVAGVKRQKVLDVIIRNKHLLVMDKQGRIERFISDEANQARHAHAEWTQGKNFKLSPINYGSDNKIVLSETVRDTYKHLIKPYCVGGLGDNYWTEYLLDAPENRAALAKDGIVCCEDVMAGFVKNMEHLTHHDWYNP